MGIFLKLRMNEKRTIEIRIYWMYLFIYIGVVFVCLQLDLSRKER